MHLYPRLTSRDKHLLLLLCNSLIFKGFIVKQGVRKIHFIRMLSIMWCQICSWNKYHWSDYPLGFLSLLLPPGLHQSLKLHFKITSIVQPDGILTLTVSILGFSKIAGSNRKVIFPQVCSCAFLFVVCNSCSFLKIIKPEWRIYFSKISHGDFSGGPVVKTLSS